MYVTKELQDHNYSGDHVSIELHEVTNSMYTTYKYTAAEPWTNSIIFFYYYLL